MMTFFNTTNISISTWVTVNNFYSWFFFADSFLTASLFITLASSFTSPLSAETLVNLRSSIQPNPESRFSVCLIKVWKTMSFLCLSNPPLFVTFGSFFHFACPGHFVTQFKEGNSWTDLRFTLLRRGSRRAVCDVFRLLTPFSGTTYTWK